MDIAYLYDIVYLLLNIFIFYRIGKYFLKKLIRPYYTFLSLKLTE